MFSNTNKQHILLLSVKVDYFRPTQFKLQVLYLSKLYHLLSKFMYFVKDIH